MSTKSQAANIIRRALSPIHSAGCWLPKTNDELFNTLKASGLSPKEIGCSSTSVGIEITWTVWTVVDAVAAKEALIGLDPMEIFPFEDADIA